MEPITLIFIMIFSLVLLMSWYLSRKRRTHHFPLYTAVTHLNGITSLHMRFDRCPIGKEAVGKIYSEFQSTILEMQDMGYVKVKFVTHMLRKGGISEFENFLHNHQMVYEHKCIRYTPWIHSALNKLAMRWHKGNRLKVHPLSLYATIRLRD